MFAFVYLFEWRLRVNESQSRGDCILDVMWSQFEKAHHSLAASSQVCRDDRRQHKLVVGEEAGSHRPRLHRPRLGQAGDVRHQRNGRLVVDPGLSKVCSAHRR